MLQALYFAFNACFGGKHNNSYYCNNGTVTNSNQSFDVTTAGTYILTEYIFNGFSSISDPVNITVSSLPPPAPGAPGPDITLYKDCFGETTNLNSLFSTTGFCSTWNTPNPSSVLPGTYRLIASNSANCTDTAFAYVIPEVAT